MGAEILDWKDKRKEDAAILNFTSQSSRNVHSRYQMLVNSLLASLNKRLLKKLTLPRSGWNTSSSQCKGKDTVFQFEILYFELTGKASHPLDLHVIYTCLPFILSFFVYFFQYLRKINGKAKHQQQKIKRNKVLLQRIFTIQLHNCLQ